MSRLFVFAALALATMSSAVAGAAGAEPPPPLKIVIVGDSTVCDYPVKYPNRGWGQFIEERFKDGTVKVINLAFAGRSTKSFIAEGRWEKALAEKPDYVLIQFGHNDAHDPARPEATEAATDYKENLRRYVDDTRAIHATPILVTPPVRRQFNAEGKIADPAQPITKRLQVYAEAMKDVAREKTVAVIDLNTSSRELAERLGPAASKELANKEGDPTHFNEKGARAMADLVMKELPTAEPKLKELLKAP